MGLEFLALSVVDVLPYVILMCISEMGDILFLKCLLYTLMIIVISSCVIFAVV